MTEVVLELSRVSKTFGSFVAVNEISFVVPRGKIVGFLGANGAGKTTTIRMVLDILKADSGEVRLFGSPVTQDALKRVGYLPEERGLYKRMRADSVVAYFASLKGMSRKDAQARTNDLMRQFGLEKFARLRIDGLSKGMQQKVGLMVAIAHDPDLLILDEPFSGLDPINQEALEKLIRRLVADGKTVMFSTHTMAHAERLADRLVILDKGRVKFEGTPAQARASLPRLVRIASEDDLSFLRQISGVAIARTPVEGQTCWEFELHKNADGRAILAACFEKGIVPSHFEIAEASLHDVFIALARQQEAVV